MQVIHINGPYPYATNTFVLISSGKAAVIIDPAASVEQYEAVLQQEGAQLAAVMLTHGHHDHIASVKALINKTNAVLFLRGEDEALAGLKASAEYKDGEIIDIDNMRFKPIFTSGHTGGSVCLLCEDMLFSGDTLFAGDVGRTDLEGGDYDALCCSLAKLAKAVPSDTRVFPGHGDFSDMASELVNNPYLKGVL